MKTAPFLITFAVIWFALALFATKDDSDAIDGGFLDRSGMAIHHDHLTGCEYVSRPWAGITPRLGEDGKQVCRTKPSK